MQHPRPGKTTYEQVPYDFGHKRKSPWALIIIVFVVILFGLFWFISRPRITTEGHQATSPTQDQTTSLAEETSSETTEQAPEGISELTTAAINTAIPHFSNRL